MRAMRERSHRQTAAETFSWAYPSPTSADSCARAWPAVTRLFVVSGAVRPYGAYHGGRDGTHTADINSTIMYMGSSPSPARARHQPGIG
jgi:hypothetical protein